MTGFRILFVCTGNICRSPFAEVLTRHLLARWLRPQDVGRFSIGSAGVNAVVGADVDSFTRGELTRRGAARTPHVARQLDRASVAAADLVLTAEREHRALVVTTHPPALRTTFCLLEFPRLLATATLDPLDQDPVRRARTAVAAAAMERGTAPPVSAAHDGVPDPLGRRGEERARGYSLIESALRTALGSVLGERLPTPPPN